MTTDASNKELRNKVKLRSSSDRKQDLLNTCTSEIEMLVTTAESPQQVNYSGTTLNPFLPRDFMTMATTAEIVTW